MEMLIILLALTCRAGFDRVCNKIFSGAQPVKASYSPTFGSDGSIQSTPSPRNVAER